MAVLSGGPTGAHKIDGIGIGYIPPLWNPDMVDEIIPVSTADANAMALRLTEEEGLFAGTSSGANVVAADPRRPATWTRQDSDNLAG